MHQVSCAEGETSAAGCHFIHLCIPVSCSPKALLLLCDSLCQRDSLWPAKQLGACSLCREQWACCRWLWTHAPSQRLALETLCHQVPDLFLPHIAWALGRQETQEVCTSADVDKFPVLPWNKQPASIAATLDQCCCMSQLCKDFVVCWNVTLQRQCKANGMWN